MGEDQQGSDGEAAEEKPPKIKANDNPWYLLATLYGEPEDIRAEINSKNRTAWNSYFAVRLNEEMRARLLSENRFIQNELALFSPQDLLEIEKAFPNRAKASSEIVSIPTPRADIKLSNVQFDQGALFGGYISPNTASASVTASA